MTYLFKLSFAICLSLSAMLPVANAAEYIPFRLLDTRGTNIQAPSSQVIRSLAKWGQFYKNATKNSNAEPPFVDFNKYQVIVIAAGARPSGGYSVVVSGVYKSADYADVGGYIMKPGNTCIVTQAITYPASFLLIPKIQKPFRFNLLNATVNC